MTEPADPEELGTADEVAQADISARTTVGPVRLAVADLGRSIDFYRETIGLAVLQEDGDAGAAVLGTGSRELVVLVEVGGARPAHPSTGLYHFALLLPERADLGRWLAHAIGRRVALTGASDHFVSEALYLRDPDGHGIEIYWDRPREVWTGKVAERLTTLPLNIEDLLAESDPSGAAAFDGLPPGTVMGHIHLKVADVDEAVTFYRDVLGLALMAQLGPSAAFLAAGGYHHHVGVNAWESRGASPPPPGSAALLEATVVLPDARARDEVLQRLAARGHAVRQGPRGPVVTDPSGIDLLLSASGA